MNHLPYKEWMLSEAPLSAEQDDALQEHLRTCEACRQIEPAWMDVKALIQKTPAAEPLPGFSGRWQIRLEQHRQSKQRLLAWIILGIIVGIALVLSALFGLQLLQILDSPGNLILLVVSRLTDILNIYWSLGGLFNSVSAYIPSVPWLLMIFGMGMLSFLSVLWLATYRKLTLGGRTA
jgi:hypothetical protein